MDEVYIPQKAIILLRESVKDPDGIASQLNRARVRMAQMGWVPGPQGTHVITEDATSASKRKVKIKIPDSTRFEYRTKRPGFNRALDMVDSEEADGLFADDIDRIARDPYDGEALMQVVTTALEQGRVIPTSSLSSNIDLATADGRFLFRILVDKGKKEADDITRRITQSHEARAKKGIPHPGGMYRMFGFSNAKNSDGDPTLVIVADEAGALQQAAEIIRLRGGINEESEADLRRLCHELGKNGITATSGKRVSPGMFRRVLVNPRVAGISFYGKDKGKGKDREYAKGNWPAIIPEEEWRSLRKIIEGSKRKKMGAPPWSRVNDGMGRPPQQLGTGIYLCGVPGCGKPVVANGPRESLSYICRSGGLARGVQNVDDIVVRKVKLWLADPELRDLIRRPPPDKTEEIHLRNKAEALQADYDELWGLYLDHSVSADELRGDRRELKSQIAAIEDRIAAIHKANPLSGATGENPELPWDGLPIDKQRAIIRELVIVTILPAIPGRRYFDPSRIIVRIRLGDGSAEDVPTPEHTAQEGHRPYVVECQRDGCTVEFPRRKGQYYCSDECRELAFQNRGGQAARSARAATRRAAMPGAIRTCERDGCMKEFPKNKAQRFCSVKCREEAARQK